MVFHQGWIHRDYVFLLSLACFGLVGWSSCNQEVLTNHWYVELDGEGGAERAMEVAKRSGFTYVGPVSRLFYSSLPY